MVLVKVAPAFVLFSANVLAILAVAAAMFLLAGFVTRAEMGSLGNVARRLAPAALGLIVITALLTSFLVGRVRELRIERTIAETLDRELAQEPSTALESIEFDYGREGLQVLSTVRTPRVIPPERVKRIQDALGAALDETVTLFLRCAMTKDVTATGTASLRPYLSLNGRVVEAPIAPSTYYVEVDGQKNEYALAESNIEFGTSAPADDVTATVERFVDEVSPTGGANQQTVSVNGKEEKLYDVNVDGQIIPMIQISQTTVGEFFDPENPENKAYQNVRLSEPVESISAHPENYTEVVELKNMARALTNTALVTILVVIGQLVTSVVGRYALPA